MKFPPFYVKNRNSYIIMLCILLKGNFLRIFFFLNQIRWKISFSCTNNKNIIFFATYGHLFEKYPKYHSLFSANDYCVQNSKGSVNCNFNYHKETILSIENDNNNSAITYYDRKFFAVKYYTEMRKGCNNQAKNFCLTLERHN